ncbi:MAG: hypothetical protein Kow0069_04160 [Promethearchaeota archaeon]
MVPADAVKATDDGFVIEVTNVISPLTVDEIPENINLAEMVTFKVDDEELDPNDFVLRFEDVEVSLQNPQAALGVTVPVGGKLMIIYKGGAKWEKGTTHTFELNVQLDNPISIKLERELN